MTEQGYPPRRPGHSGRQGRPGTSREPAGGWQLVDSFDDGPDSESDLPPWAIPGGIAPHRAGRRPLPGEPGRAGGQDTAGGAGYRTAGPASADHPVSGPAVTGPPPARPGRRTGRRALAARRRRYQRRLVTWGGVGVVIVLLVGAGLWLARSPAPKSRYVTTLQKGEYRTVPDACRVLGTADLHRLLGATPKKVQTFNAPAQSQCTFTVDKQPVFRVLTIMAQAYGASLTAAGNGSATANATYNFGLARARLAKPPKRSQDPPATITAIRGLGSEAFGAVQIFRNSSVTDWVTVTARYRNVLFTASMQAQASGGFGPVTPAELRSGALAAARAVFAEVKAEQTVS